MTPLVSVVLVCLLAAVFLRRGWINSVERRLARRRASTREACTFLVFVRELKAIASDPARSCGPVEEVVAMLTEAAGATSGAFFMVMSGGVLERVAVVGAHPTQIPTESALNTRAAGIAASMGTESVRIAHGVAGRAARECRTAVAEPGKGSVARIAFPVRDAEGVVGVVSLAAPCTGGAFAPRGIAFVERLIAAAGPTLLRGSETG